MRAPCYDTVFDSLARILGDSANISNFLEILKKLCHISCNVEMPTLFLIAQIWTHLTYVST